MSQRWCNIIQEEIIYGLVEKLIESPAMAVRQFQSCGYSFLNLNDGKRYRVDVVVKEE